MPPAPQNGNPEADILLELATFLAADPNNKLTLASNLFLNTYPEPGLSGVPDNPEGLFLNLLPGPAPDEYIDTETFMVDIWASAPDTNAAQALLRQVFNILQRKGNYTLQNWYVYFSSASGTIRNESRGTEGNRLMSQTWRLIARNLNNIS